jgi:hypothetical protein
LPDAESQPAAEASFVTAGFLFWAWRLATALPVNGSRGIWRSLDTLPSMRASRIATTGSVLAGLFSPLLLVVAQSANTLDAATAARADQAIESAIAATGIQARRLPWSSTGRSSICARMARGA